MLGIDALKIWGAAFSAHTETRRPEEAPELLHWLKAGRLRLVHPSEGTIAPDRWSSLPAGMRTHALEDFRRLVASNANSAVIYLRDERIHATQDGVRN